MDNGSTLVEPGRLFVALEALRLEDKAYCQVPIVESVAERESALAASSASAPRSKSPRESPGPAGLNPYDVISSVGHQYAA